MLHPVFCVCILSGHTRGFLQPNQRVLGILWINLSAKGVSSTARVSAPRLQPCTYLDSWPVAPLNILLMLSTVETLPQCLGILVLAHRTGCLQPS